MNIREWLAYGRARGYCSAAHCDAHDGLPLTDDEAEAYDAGEDLCCIVVRVYDDALTVGD